MFAKNTKRLINNQESLEELYSAELVVPRMAKMSSGVHLPYTYGDNF